jgi:hypothetical protein
MQKPHGGRSPLLRPGGVQLSELRAAERRRAFDPKALALTMPQMLLVAADEVIE